MNLNLLLINSQENLNEIFFETKTSREAKAHKHVLMCLSGDSCREAHLITSRIRYNGMCRISLATRHINWIYLIVKNSGTCIQEQNRAEFRMTREK